MVGLYLSSKLAVLNLQSFRPLISPIFLIQKCCVFYGIGANVSPEYYRFEVTETKSITWLWRISVQNLGINWPDMAKVE